MSKNTLFFAECLYDASQCVLTGERLYSYAW